MTLALYGDALGLPLFSDDLLQIPWLESISWGEVWTSASPYGYYRPLWYSLWRVWGLLAGGLRPAGLHSLNLIAHFIAAWLAGLLASAWIRPAPHANPIELGALPAITATVIFVVFPFARQAVAWPGAIYNPLVSAMAVGAFLAYDRARSRRASGWLILALALAVLAPLTYEAGLMVAPAILLLEAVGWWYRRWSPRAHWWGLLTVAISAATLVFWRLMRGAGVTLFGLAITDLVQNMSYLAQGVVYPAAPLGQTLASLPTLEPTVALWLIALPVISLLVWVGFRRQSDACILGIGWILLFALPPTVSMAADWFALAPRFLYMIACGTALLWTIGVIHCTEFVESLVRRPAAKYVRAVVLLALLVGLAPAILFVRRGMNLYEMAGEPIWAAVEGALRATDDELGESRRFPLLLVNLPMRITPRERLYPLGFEGVTPLPQRVTAEGLVAVHTGLDYPARAVASGLIAGEEPNTYSRLFWGPDMGWEDLAETSRWAGTVYVARYSPSTISLVEAGGSPDQVPDSTPVAVFFSTSTSHTISLVDVSAACDRDGHVSLTATWETRAATKIDVTVFAHLLTDDGATLLSQADGYPLLGMRPFWLWQPGERLRDIRYFDPVPPSTRH